MKSENKTEFEQEGTMENTKTNSINSEWIIIGGRKYHKNRIPQNIKFLHIVNGKRQWERHCPHCYKKIIYKSCGWLCLRAEKEKSVCTSCGIEKMRKSMIGKRASKETKLKMSMSRMGRKVSNKTREKLSKANKGHVMSEEQKEKISILRIKNGLAKGKNNPMFGKRHSDNTKRKIRTAYIKNLTEKFGAVIVPNFNKKACQFIGEYGKQNGYKFQHALNGGEFSVLGYFVDGYDKKKNVIFEYDESHHCRKQEKDTQRMTEIKRHLGCKFIRYNERTKQIKEY